MIKIRCESFGRGPECATYADYLLRRAPFTFSNCEEKNYFATLSFERGLVPPGVRGHCQAFFLYSCFEGLYSLVGIPEFQMLYFLDEDAETCCGVKSDNRLEHYDKFFRHC